MRTKYSLSTIHFYIILKLFFFRHLITSRLSTIHFYIILKPVMHPATAVCSLSTIHFYIILKRRCVCIVHERLFEYHTFLHHSQTGFGKVNSSAGLSTIHFYIILKPIVKATEGLRCLSTIHFYIILKRCDRILWQSRV